MCLRFRHLSFLLTTIVWKSFKPPNMDLLKINDREDKKDSLISCVIFGDQAFEGVGWDVLNEGVELALALVIFISSSGDSNSDSFWDVSNSSAPKELIQLLVDSNIL